ncbi:MAG: T9SS type A sorting domain-containing protein [Saprospiraceae bacterium]|nr:T9SS type A sorting domain-containing protein [Saprospiraceae bacterium]
MNPVSEARSSKVVVLGMEDQELKAGEEAELAVMAGNFSDIAGFQYTMNLKGANYVGIRPGALEMTRANVGLISKDEVTMSYAGKQGITLGEGTVLYTIIVKADRAVKVSEMLSIGSAVTPAESYTHDFAVGKVSLEIRTAPVTAITLMQNEPNPFKGQTTISFNMPNAAAATLSVYDVTGKVVSVRNIQTNKGLNSEIFTREQLGASGVMYYTLKSGDFTATKKMIVIE